MNKERKEMMLYALAVLVPTTVVSACFPFFQGNKNLLAGVIMFFPGLAAAGFILRSRQGFRAIGWGAGPPIYWLWAVLLPFIMIFVMTVPISIWLGYVGTSPEASAGGSTQTPVLKMLMKVLLYTAISMPLALAEEFGWRGYAQGKLVREFGLLRGLLLLGILWGFWHTPVFYFAGAFSAHPFVGPFVMTPIDNITVVIPMGWLYLRSRSIWIPTLAHAFGDVLVGLSDHFFPARREIPNWAVLQCAAVIISIILFMDLRTRPGGAPSS